MLRLVETPPHRADFWFSLLPCRPLPASGARCAASDHIGIETVLTATAMRLAGELLIALALTCAPAWAQESQKFAPEQIHLGAELFARNCSPCHGARMQDPGSAFNLRKFPRDQRERFVNSVTRGKNQMPPWGDFFKPDQLEALWAYVIEGER